MGCFAVEVAKAAAPLAGGIGLLSVHIFVTHAIVVKMGDYSLQYFRFCGKIS